MERGERCLFSYISPLSNVLAEQNQEKEFAQLRFSDTTEIYPKTLDTHGEICENMPRRFERSMHLVILFRRTARAAYSGALPLDTSPRMCDTLFSSRVGHLSFGIVVRRRRRLCHAKVAPLRS